MQQARPATAPAPPEAGGPPGRGALPGALREWLDRLGWGVRPEQVRQWLGALAHRVGAARIWRRLGRLAVVVGVSLLCAFFTTVVIVVAVWSFSRQIDEARDAWRERTQWGWSRPPYDPTPEKVKALAERLGTFETRARALGWIEKALGASSELRRRWLEHWVGEQRGAILGTAGPQAYCEALRRLASDAPVDPFVGRIRRACHALRQAKAVLHQRVDAASSASSFVRRKKGELEDARSRQRELVEALSALQRGEVIPFRGCLIGPLAGADPGWYEVSPATALGPCDPWRRVVLISPVPLTIEVPGQPIYDLYVRHVGPWPVILRNGVATTWERYEIVGTGNTFAEKILARDRTEAKVARLERELEVAQGRLKQAQTVRDTAKRRVDLLAQRVKQIVKDPGSRPEASLFAVALPEPAAVPADLRRAVERARFLAQLAARDPLDFLCPEGSLEASGEADGGQAEAGAEEADAAEALVQCLLPADGDAPQVLTAHYEGRGGLQHLTVEEGTGEQWVGLYLVAGHLRAIGHSQGGRKRYFRPPGPPRTLRAQLIGCEGEGPSLRCEVYAEDDRFLTLDLSSIASKDAAFRHPERLIDRWLRLTVQEVPVLLGPYATPRPELRIQEARLLPAKGR
ncbi:MAG: hypothetical protein D6729_06175 [Deltaproteobacteria bacterium]|nr:MAG: hypothetical protein D6729_06175 [Deltaproteobacteria bacterium]